jgi:hypothetical protein
MAEREPMPLKDIKSFTIESGEFGEINMTVVYRKIAVRDKKGGHRWK